MKIKYPQDNEIKVQITTMHWITFILISFLVAGFLIYELKFKIISFTKYLSVSGLYIDIIGVLIASLKTPDYGNFADGGEINFKRDKVEKKYFQFGMLLIAFGMILQMLGTLL